MSKRGRWIIAGAALALLLSCAALLLLGRPVAANSGLAAARELWAGRQLGAYRLTLVQETRRGTCEQEMRADDERSGTALRNSCGQPATWTVTRLFNWIAELERTETRCYPGPAFCACQGTASTSVVYDQALGYPREIVYEWRKRPNLTNLAYYQSLFDQSFPGCDKDGQGGPVVVKILLAPEP